MLRDGKDIRDLTPLPLCDDASIITYPSVTLDPSVTLAFEIRGRCNAMADPQTRCADEEDIRHLEWLFMLYLQVVRRVYPKTLDTTQKRRKPKTTARVNNYSVNRWQKALKIAQEWLAKDEECQLQKLERKVQAAEKKSRASSI